MNLPLSREELDRIDENNFNDVGRSDGESANILIDQALLAIELKKENEVLGNDIINWVSKFTKALKELKDANDTIDQIGKQVYDLNLHMLEQEEVINYMIATYDFDCDESRRNPEIEAKIRKYMNKP